MKKMLFFLLLSSFAFGQLTQDSIQSIAKTHFEETYVTKYFKDIYSYELKKTWSAPIDKETILIQNISVAQSYVDKKLLPKKTQAEFVQRISNMKAELQKLSGDEKRKIVAYDVYFDTYGANSYGNKVLGKYILRYDAENKILGDVTERR